MRALVVLMLLARPADACDAEECSWMLGMRLFHQGQYDQAIALFDQGYQFSGKPKFLFEIAESHRLAGRHGEAMLIYEQFLAAAPETANRVETEAHLAQSRLAFLSPVPPDKPYRGNVMSGLGGGLLATGVVLAISSLFAFRDGPRLALGLLGGGLAVTGGGATLLAVGVTRR